MGEKYMKRFLLLLLSAMLVFASCIDTKNVFAADDSAYAVLTDSGELIFLGAQMNMKMLRNMIVLLILITIIIKVLFLMV